MKHSHRFSKSRIFRRTWLVAITMVLTAFAKPYAQADPGFDRPPMDDKPMAIASKLADAIGLDEEATTKFIKTYAAYIRSLRRLNDRYDFYPGRNITEKQAQQNIDNRFRLSHEIIQLREQYYKKFKTFMTQTVYQKR